MTGEVKLDVWQPVKTTGIFISSRTWLAQVRWRPPTTGDWAVPCECKPCTKAAWMQQAQLYLDKAWPFPDQFDPWHVDWDESDYFNYGYAWDCMSNDFAGFSDSPGLYNIPTFTLPFLLSFQGNFWSFVKCLEGMGIDEDLVAGAKNWRWEHRSFYTAHWGIKGEVPEFKSAAFNPDVNHALIHVFGYESEEDVKKA